MSRSQCGRWMSLARFCAQFWAGLLLASAVHASGAPTELERWRAWVLHGLEYLDCPLRHDQVASSEEAARHCQFPGALQLDLDRDGGRFQIEWLVRQAGWVALPGSAEAWPDQIRVNGQPVAVRLAGATPQLWLETGRQRVEGVLRWHERPQQLTVPTPVARVELMLDGEAVAQPERRGAQLWLGDRERAASQADTLQLEVYRLLADDIPATLTTRIQLTVTGRAREVQLGPVLPEGYLALGLSGSLPQRLEADGQLRVQLAPGQHRLELRARAVQVLTGVAPAAAVGEWPAFEVWSFQPGRLQAPAEPSGAEPVDPAQAGVPPEWQSYAAFLLNPGDALALTRSDVAAAAVAPNRVRLVRELWLDFDGGGWTAMDALDGEMRQGWRLDALPLLPLQRAESAGEPLLLTRAPDDSGAVGVEWRASALSVQSSARLPGGHRVPASGWRETLDDARLSINLPPGYQLLAALGADQAGSAWIARWRLGEIFLLCLGGLLAWKLAGWQLTVPALLYLGLSNGHLGAPLFSLLFLLLLLLGLRWISAAKPARWLRFIAWPSFVVLLLIALPYAANQFTLLLYPQLEHASVGSRGFNQATSQVISYGGLYRHRGDSRVAGNVAADSMEVAAPMPEPAMEGPQAVSNVQQGKGKLLGKQQQQLNRVDPKAIVQAGGAEPQWRWNSHQLAVAGPVRSDHQIRLVLSPPWLTALWRLLAVAALGWLVASALGQLLGSARRGARWPRWLVVALCLPGFAQAAEYPNQALLDEYRARLLEAPECAPNCAQLNSVVVETATDRLTLTMDLHLATDLSVPLPHAELWQPGRVLVDGQAQGWLLSDGDVPWLPLTAGVRRVQLEGTLVGERLRLSFPLLPARIEGRSEQWLVNGIERDRLPGGQLELVRMAPAESGGGSLRPAEVPSYVLVTRAISIDLDWMIETVVSRVAPTDGALQVPIPLLDGERLLSVDPPVVDDQVQVTLRAGQSHLSYSSRLPTGTELRLRAPELAERTEIWLVAVSPIFHARFEGPPTLLALATGDGADKRFNPLPGDELLLRISRPEALAGSTLAIDGVGIRSRYGTRLRESEISIQLRATRGGQHTIMLPPAAELLRLDIDGRTLSLRPDGGRLQVPVTPGSQALNLSLREPAERVLLADFPAIDLGLPAANIGMALNLPADRWLLWTSGPAIGPAVRFWSLLALVVLLAVVLGRSGRSPIGMREALILGIGLATVAWWAVLLVGGWLLLLDWRRRVGAALSKWPFDLLQLLLVGMTGVVLLVLIGSVWAGLLGQPAMRVEGNGSSAPNLIWFADHSTGALPTAWAFSVPLWVYKAAILLWSLWLANAVVRWFKLALDALGEGGWWKRLRAVPVAQSLAVEAGSDKQGTRPRAQDPEEPQRGA